MTEIREFKPTTKGFPDFFCAMGLGCQKVVSSFLIANCPKPGLFYSVGGGGRRGDDKIFINYKERILVIVSIVKCCIS